MIRSFRQAHRTVRKRRGFSYLELLVSVILLSIAAAGALQIWSFSVRVPATKRVTEMGVFVGTQHLERLKAQKYSSLLDGNTVTYYDRYGAYLDPNTGLPWTGAQPRGYKVKTTIAALVNRDGVVNTEDLREIKIEVWDNNETVSQPYERIRALLTFGGV